MAAYQKNKCSDQNRKPVNSHTALKFGVIHQGCLSALGKLLLSSVTNITQRAEQGYGIGWKNATY
jgi:hypothetical protein